MDANIGKYYIWWQVQSDSELIVGALDRGFLKLPDWLRDQCFSRNGRPGRGRLWVADHITLDEIEWDDSKTPQSDWALAAGGIVIEVDQLSLVLGLPGFVTDTELNLMRAAKNAEAK